MKLTAEEARRIVERSPFTEMNHIYEMIRSAAAGDKGLFPKRYVCISTEHIDGNLDKLLADGYGAQLSPEGTYYTITW